MHGLGLDGKELAKVLDIPEEELKRLSDAWLEAHPAAVLFMESGTDTMFRRRRNVLVQDASQAEVRVLAHMMENNVPVPVPDMHTHLAKVTGLERHEIKALQFSEVYGVTRESYVSIYGERGVQVLTMQFLRKFPKIAHVAKLRKSRSRLMVDALQDKVTKGNQEVRMGGNFFVFAYRGTDILKWVWDTTEGDGISDMDAGQYEETPSTHNQRKMAREAIEEFRSVVLCL
jgi:hypothetical protein